MLEDFTLTEKLAIAQTALLILIFLSLNKGLIKNSFKKGKVFLKRLIVVSIYYASRFFPRSKKIIVFGAENGKALRGNPKYLFYEAIKEDRVRCMWIFKSKKAVNEARLLGYESYYFRSPKGIYYQLRAKLFIHSHSIHDDFNRSLLGGAISVCTWHGVGLKKVFGANKKTFTYKTIHEKNRIKRFFNMFVVRTQNAKESYVISTSDEVSSYYPETFLVKKENLIQMGQARNDIFFKQTEEDEKFPEYIKKNKIITYMPTHRNFGKLDDNINTVMDLRALDAFCEENGYLFLVKRHMYSSGRVPKTLKNIIDVSNDNLDPQMLLKYTDILITDYSSCYTDYLLLDRPVIFYCYDLQKYLTKSNEMYFEYEDVTPGPKAKDFDALMQALYDAVNHQDGYRQERKRVLDIFYSEENQAPVTEKQMKYIFEHILKLDNVKKQDVKKTINSK